MVGDAAGVAAQSAAQQVIEGPRHPTQDHRSQSHRGQQIAGKGPARQSRSGDENVSR